MDLMRILKLLFKNKKITAQQYRTYKGQAIHGDEIGCINGLNRRGLLSDKKAEDLIDSIKLAYTE